MCDSDVFEKFLISISTVRTFLGKEIHCVKNPKNEGLVNLLGNKWFERIMNKNCDYCYAIEGTIQFWLPKKKKHQRIYSKRLNSIINKLIKLSEILRNK